MEYFFLAAKTLVTEEPTVPTLRHGTKSLLINITPYFD